jgi:PhnB protein
MTDDDTVSFTPKGWRTITPRIVARDSRDLVEFVKQVFEARGEYRDGAPTVLSIGDSMIMISDTGVRGPTPAFLYVYVRDADETYRLAVSAGAVSVEEPRNLPYGDRRAMVEDRWGNIWQIATLLPANFRWSGP